MAVGRKRYRGDSNRQIPGRPTCASGTPTRSCTIQGGAGIADCTGAELRNGTLAADFSRRVTKSPVIRAPPNSPPLLPHTPSAHPSADTFFKTWTNRRVSRPLTSRHPLFRRAFSVSTRLQTPLELQPYQLPPASPLPHLAKMEYSTLKVPELRKLLQERNLLATGNKADLVARLQEDDKNKAPAAAQPGTSSQPSSAVTSPRASRMREYVSGALSTSWWIARSHHYLATSQRVAG